MLFILNINVNNSMNDVQNILLTSSGLIGVVFLIILLFATSYFGKGFRAGKTTIKRLHKRLLGEVVNVPLEKQDETINLLIWQRTPKPEFIKNRQLRIDKIKAKKQNMEDEYNKKVDLLERHLKEDCQKAEESYRANTRFLENEIQKVDLGLSELKEQLIRLQEEQERLMLSHVEMSKEYKDWKKENKTPPLLNLFRKLFKGGGLKFNKAIKNIEVVKHIWPVLVFAIIIIVDFFLSSTFNEAATAKWNLGDGSMVIRMTVALLLILVFAFEIVVHRFYKNKEFPSVLKKVLEAFALILSIISIIYICVAVLDYRDHGFISSDVSTGLYVGAAFIATLFLDFADWRLVWKAIKSIIVTSVYTIISLLLLPLFIVESIVNLISIPFVKISSYPKKEELVLSSKNNSDKINSVKAKIEERQSRRDSLFNDMEKASVGSLEEIKLRHNESKENEKAAFANKTESLEIEIDKVENDQRCGNFRAGVDYAINRYFKFD